MLGLGSNLAKTTGGLKTIVTDNLVLKHNYDAGQVHQVSTGAAFFDGSDDYINTGAAFQSTLRDSFSISMWVKAIDGRPSAEDTIIGTTNNPVEDGVRVDVLTDGKLRFAFESNNDLGYITTDSAYFSDGITDWTHIACTATKGGSGDTALVMYVNGVALATTLTGATTVANHALYTSDINLLIGARMNDTTVERFFNGYICNVGIWDTALSQADVKSIMWKNYADLISGETANLVSWYNLDSVIDSTETVGVGSTTVYDNHHGGGDTLSANLVTSYEVVGTQATSKWIAFPDDGSALLTSDNNILTATIGGGANSANEGARYEVTGLSGYAAGKTYKVQADLWLGTYEPDPTGAFRIQLGASGKNITLSTTRTTFTVYITTTDTSDLIFYQDDADNSVGTFFIANVSLQLVNGNTGTLS